MAMAANASAQTYIDFHQMPLAKAPSPMPDSYPAGINLNWDNFYYVTPGMWKDAGPGFRVDPSTLHNTVAFMGGPQCSLGATCSGSIKLNRVQGTNTAQTFTPISISMAAGWLPNNVIVTAYNTSKFVGSAVWELTTEPKTFSFPATWKNVTQLVFTPEVSPTNAVYPKAGSMVIYSFILIKH
jgi:hypothetical protein